MAAKGPLREFGTDPVSERPVVAKDGKFGVYVTDGETNASLGKGDRLDAMAPERAYELLAIRREAIIAKGGAREDAPAKKKAPAKKSRRSRPAKKAAREEGPRQEDCSEPAADATASPSRSSPTSPPTTDHPSHVNVCNRWRRHDRHLFTRSD